MRASPQQLLSVVPHGGPLYLQIYHRIRSLILSGAWPPGACLPSSRALARDLKVSRNTAILAIEKLMADGWVISRAGSGIYVSSEAPPARPPRQSETTATGAATVVPIPLEIGQPATDAFPIEEWAKIQRNVWSTAADHALHEGPVEGWPELRSQVASYLHAVRGVDCSPDQILILGGTQSAIDLCVRVLGKAGDGIWTENPGYPYGRKVFQAHGLNQILVPVDAEGISVVEGIAKGKSAKLAYVTPACQFPTCAILSDERRKTLLSWAEDQGSYIVEDDWDFHSVFDGRLPEPLLASNSERVILIHSFNRLLFPGLRIAALVIPRPLIEPFIDNLYSVERYQNVSNQIALAEFMHRGLLSSHLRRCNSLYRERRDAMHNGISKYLGKYLHVRSGQAGLHCLAWTRGLQDSKVAAEVRSSGVACLALNDFVIDADVPSALILGFAAFSPDTINDALRDVARIIASST